MKKLYKKPIFLLAAILICLTVNSQPTLTGPNTNPQIGESFTLHSIDVTSVTEGSSGANVSWDFSSDTSLGTNTITWIDPATTPYAASFPNANLCYVIGGGYYDYYSGSSTAYTRHGAVDPNSTVIAYSDPQQHIGFPCTYNTTFTDSFASTYVSAGDTYYRSGTITVTADAYGILFLPYGTISGVIRLKTVEDYQDAVDLGGYPYLIYYSSEVYIWYKPGTHYPVFSLTSFTSSVGGTTNYGSYLDQSGAGIYTPFASKFDIEIFPNPASSFVNMNYSIKSGSDLKASLVNMQGQEIEVLMKKNLQPGTYTEIIEIGRAARRERV